jgi:hypothetical protein
MAKSCSPRLAIVLGSLVSGEVTSSFNLTMTSCLKNYVLLEFVFHVRRFNGKVGRCPFCCGEWEGAVTKSVNKAYRHRYNLAFLTRSAPRIFIILQRLHRAYLLVSRCHPNH